MIFLTVGTHEQAFDRLVMKIDELKMNKNIDDDIFIQSGYCTYEAKYCEWKKFLDYKDMIKMIKKSEIVITHGGASSFIMALQMGKIPIVVPRQKKYNEHVNDHQLEFAESVKERYNNIIILHI